MPERNTVFDVDGKIYSRLAGANRLKVSLDQISPFFVNALLAREDTRFFQHNGIDFYGIGRALVRDSMSGSAKEGASSLTQQLARNSLPLGGRTVSRKLLEAMVALRIERDFTKQQILELYINRIYFGSGCYGVETASQAYFGKNASALNLPEAALLAGLIRSPNRFSPLRNPDGAALQRDAVLDRMVELKKISAVEANEAKLAKVNPHPKRLLQIQENYAMDAVQRDLNALLTQDQIDNGGLFIYTTLDPAVQNAAQEALETQLTKIERQSNFHHPVKAKYQPPESGEDSSMPIPKARSWRSTTPAAVFALWWVVAIIRRANSIALSHPRIGRLVPLSSRSCMRLPLPMGSCPAQPSVTAPFNQAKSTVLETGRREIPTALTAA